MAEQFTKEEIRQAFYDLAEEMEKECGDWQSSPENEYDRNVKNHVLALVLGKEKKVKGDVGITKM